VPDQRLPSFPLDSASPQRDGHADASGTDRPLIVFIAGAGRSGSTVLGDALGQMPGCFHAGELRFVLEQLESGDRICGCGCSIRDCELWQAVRSQAFGPGLPPLDPHGLAHFSINELSYRPRLWLKLRRQAGLPAPLGTSAEHYAEALRRLYAAIATVTGAEMVVDSSKAAMHVYLGARCAGIRAHVVHLVRDPRAIAYSWRRRSIEGVTHGPTHVSINWVAGNLAVEAFNNRAVDLRYTFVRYEDFVRDPMATLGTLSGQIGLRRSSLPFVDATTLHLEPNHTVAGNPSRFKSGNIRLVPDDEWRQSMHARDQMLVTLLAAVLLRRYAYPLRVAK
jgi:hypothetical protein